MRFVSLCVLLHLISGSALADELVFKRQLYQHIMENGWVIPLRLQNKAVQVGVVFSIDRDGKILNATVDQSSGSRVDDADILSSLKRMRPFPRVPDELNVPYEAKTTFNLGMQKRIGYVDLQWQPTAQTSGQEIAYRSDVQQHLRVYPHILPDDINISSEVRSVVTFSLDRDGRLVDAKVTKSSGAKAIDDQTVTWLKAIQPFPKMPSDLGSPMKLTAELVFAVEGTWNDEQARSKVNSVCRGC
ncbi:TonB family protein [Bradyrhizobium sp. HKCCYLS2038]|uniref:TonB family protein n=1 Tax=unclassified Bradyrhizobium TaxID=2631580 RepID=UPI003EBA2CD3